MSYTDEEYQRLSELGVSRAQADAGRVPVRLLLRAYERAYDAHDSRMLQFLLEKAWKAEPSSTYTQSMTLSDEELERRLRV